MTFYELEKECKKRKKIVYLIVFFIIFSVIALGLFLYFYLTNIHQSKTTKPIKKPLLKKVSKQKNIENKTKIVVQKSTKVLKPIINLDIKIDNNHAKQMKQTKEEEIKPKNKLIKPQFMLQVKELPSFDTCILLAKNYYNHKDYHNALKWAKNANIQNKEDRRSWIIVAKSLYKLNQKEKAIKILKTYYNYTKDKKILEVLKRIKNGQI